MKTGKLTKNAANWIKKNPTIAALAQTVLQGPAPNEMEAAYQLYRKDTSGLRSEMTQEDLNKYLQIVRSRASGEY